MNYLKNLWEAIIGKTRKDDEEPSNRVPTDFGEAISLSFPGNGDRYLVSFNGYSGGGSFITTNSDEGNGEGGVSPVKQMGKVKIAVTPKSVLGELERIPSNWSLEGLDDKIQIVKDKLELIGQSYTKIEVSGLLRCLENRKKYNTLDKDGKPFWQFFAQFDITNEAKIKDLLDKYALRMDGADIFIPEFPGEAVKIMKEFTEKVEELCGKKSRFYVIAEEESFKKNYEKRDPILLAQSPFGFYYNILGAWEKEMVYLPEL